MVPLERLMASPEDTRAVGEALGRCLEAGDVVGLVGDLGAGKTLFVQGMATGLGIGPEVRVTSPTFTLINEHRGGRLVLHHADLYRIERARELDEIGLDELVGAAGVLAVEWSDRFPVLPADRLDVSLAVAGASARRLRVAAGGPVSGRRLEALRGRLG